MATFLRFVFKEHQSGLINDIYVVVDYFLHNAHKLVYLDRMFEYLLEIIKREHDGKNNAK